MSLAVGCSSKTGGGDADALAEVRGFCLEWAERACNDTVVSHCSAADADACVAGQRQFCESIVDDGKYSRLTAEACLDGVEEAYADAQLTAEERDTVRLLGPPCDKIVSGSTGGGGTCTEDTDCNRDVDLLCVKKAGRGTGTCQIPQAVGGGRDCSAADAVCESGFYCDGTNCLAEKVSGAACSESVPCSAATRCLTPDGQPPTTTDGGEPPAASCEPRSSVGRPCKDDDDCTTRICSLRAGTEEGVCSAVILLSPTDPHCASLMSAGGGS
jgi:hypothetical protein